MRRHPPTSTLFPYTTLFRSNGLLFNVRKRAARGVTLQWNYTWSHCISPDQDTLNGSLYAPQEDRKSTRLNSSHLVISYAVFCLKKNNRKEKNKHKDD